MRRRPATTRATPATTRVPADDRRPPALPEDERLALLETVEITEDAPPDVIDLRNELDEAEHLVLELDREVRAARSGSVVVEHRPDEQLVVLARTGDEVALSELLTRYRPFTRMRARSYFLVGADREDVVQEGMIGLYKAVRDFQPDRGSSFRGFAELCVTRQIISAVKSATRQKHGPLNNYVSFSGPSAGDDEGERDLADVLPTSTLCDPADLLISAERIRKLQSHVDEVLSDLETEVLRLYVEGKSYQEIAERLQRHVKSIDNALQRVKKKLEGHLRERAVADAG